MIIHPVYGPQIDPTDGTCGQIKLVKRFVMVSGDPPCIWGPRQGRYTRATRKEMQKQVDAIRKCNSSDLYPKDLRVTDWWCWPGHFDPAYPTIDEQYDTVVI